MRLLAIDTSTDRCSVGVAIDGAPPVLRSEDVGRAHAERLIPMIAEATAAAGLEVRDLDRIAVTVGPGSFTGVRIGVAAARGLTLATGAPAVGIGTLAVHAAEARVIAGDAAVFVAVTAARGEIYAERFAAHGPSTFGPVLAAPGALAVEVGFGDVLCGSGADALVAVAGARRIAHRHAQPDIVALLRLGAAADLPAEPPKPLYLRPPDAKPQAGARVARR